MDDANDGNSCRRICCRQVRPCADREQNHALIERTLTTLRLLSLAMVFLGSLSILIGVAIVSINGDYSRFPMHTGSQIWSGTVTFIAGILGFTATTVYIDRADDFPSQARCLICGFYGVCVTLPSLNGINFGYSISGLIECTKNRCSENNTAMVVLLTLAIGIGLLMLVFGFLGMAFFSYNHRLFGITWCKKTDTSQDERNEQNFTSFKMT